ncbi:tRNA wybutosine-synthesizing protein 3 [Candida viswanathii]|uniref:tRNA wybutosine-synthesizing protein 3 n=1 Tax=Candida viswanathii TaxID=5486 RepID=A0A367Y037_9ASCO|nr:tRNA wybutosine-synthesizing protein 3 [Candida viswanathii]
MQDSFDQKKQSILEEISTNGPDNLDASPKGTIDEHCIPIINLINKHKDMVTTSSCSGRVSVFLEGVKSADSTSIVAKGNYGRWLFVTHDPKDLDNWYDSIDFTYDTTRFPTDNGTRSILYKFEAVILHVKCRDETTAQRLYILAMNNGFRESGIGNNFNVAIRINIKLDIPIGFTDAESEKLRCFVNKEYLEYITLISHERFRENFKKLDQLYGAVEKMMTEESNGEAGSKKKNKYAESKEERRERMIREGLQRQQSMKKLKE